MCRQRGKIGQGLHQPVEIRRGKAGIGNVTQQGGERCPIVIAAEQPDRFVMNAEFAPGQRFEQFIQGPDAARQRDDGIGAGVHHRFAFVQGLDDVKLVTVGLGDFGGHQQARDDADDTAAARHRGARRNAHQADRAAAIDKGDAVVGEQCAERGSKRDLRRIMAGARAAKKQDGFNHGRSMPLRQPRVISLICA